MVVFFFNFSRGLPFPPKIVFPYISHASLSGPFLGFFSSSHGMVVFFPSETRLLTAVFFSKDLLSESCPTASPLDYRAFKGSAACKRLSTPPFLETLHIPLSPVVVEDWCEPVVAAVVLPFLSRTTALRRFSLPSLSNSRSFVPPSEQQCLVV